MCSSYLLISSLFRRQTVNDLSRIPADFCTVTCSLTHILTYAGLVLRTCQHSFCHANFELRPKSVNSCFLRIHISAMLFCASTSRRCSYAHPIFHGTSGRHPLGFIFPCFRTAFCASNVPWNFREASVSIHFIISYIDCHEICRGTKGQGR